LIHFYKRIKMKLTRRKMPKFSDVEYDVKLICGKKIFSSHRLLLAASSHFLKDIIQEASEESSGELLTILLPDFDQQEVGNLLSILYNTKDANVDEDMHTYARTEPTNMSPLFSQLRIGETPMKAPSVLLQQKKMSLREKVEDSLPQSVVDTANSDEVYQQILDMAVERLVNGSWVKLNVSLKKDAMDSQDTYSEFTCQNCLKDLVRCINQNVPHCKECNPCSGCNVEEYPMVDVTTTPVDLVDNSLPISNPTVIPSVVDSCSDAPVECSKDQTVKCDLCGKSMTKSNYQKHMKLHIDRQPHMCDQCPARYSDKRYLKKHVARNHSESTNSDTEPKSHVCDVCDEVFPSARFLTMHSKEKHFKVLPFKCQYCEKGFIKKQGLDKHEMLHRGEKQFECALCGEGFYLKRALITHIGKVHPGVVLIKCFHCSETFDSIDERSEHMEAAHPYVTVRPKEILDLYDGSIVGAEKTFVCEVCNKAFAQKHYLKGHMRVHTGERPYKCSQCEKTFTQLSTLSKHMPTHTGKWPFTCDLCPKGFAKRSELDHHQAKHGGKKIVKCELCEKMFYSVKCMRRHIKLYHGAEKAFPCDLCGEAFTRNKYLMSHMTKFHKLTKQIVCPECLKVFSTQYSLNRHLSKVHDIVKSEVIIEEQESSEPTM